MIDDDDDDTHGAALKSIHTKVVADAIAAAGPNRVLGVVPSKISGSEERLLRDWRCTLSQLCSGFSKSLQSFILRIGAAASDICPDCGGIGHSTLHLRNLLHDPNWFGNNNNNDKTTKLRMMAGTMKK